MSHVVAIDEATREQLRTASTATLEPTEKNRPPTHIADGLAPIRDGGTAGMPIELSPQTEALIRGKVEQGLLLYPVHEVSVRDEVSIRYAPVIVRQTTLDLSGDAVTLPLACDHFAQEVFSYAKI